MKVLRYNNGISIDTFETDETNIRVITATYGRTNDTLELYNGEDELVARAVWPRGYKIYRYSYGKNLDPVNPSYCVYID